MRKIYYLIFGICVLMAHAENVSSAVSQEDNAIAEPKCIGRLPERQGTPYGLPDNCKVRSNEPEDTEEVVCDVVVMDKGGELADRLGNEANEIDSLVVIGPMNDADFETLRIASLKGRLQALNLEKAKIEGRMIPDHAFFKTDQTHPNEGYVDVVALRRVILPPGIESIGKCAFLYAVHLEQINMPADLKRLDDSAFEECQSLCIDPLVFPEGFETIGKRAFFSCRKLTGEVVLPYTIKNIDDLAFGQAKITSINFPEGLERIGDAAFFGCRLTEATLPNSCQNLDGSDIFSLNLEMLKLRLPDGITTVPETIAQYCQKLEEVYVPSSVKSIEAGAFDGCESLKKLVLPEGLEQIKSKALAHLSSLGTLSLPSTVKYLDLESCLNDWRYKVLYCAAPVPPECLANPEKPLVTAFGSFEPGIATSHNPVYVPVGSAQLYREAAGWSYYFDNFIETDIFPGTSVSEIIMDEEQGDGCYYDLIGNRVANPVPGNIYIRNKKKIIYQ